MKLRTLCRPPVLPLFSCGLALLACGVRQPAMLGAGMALLGLALGTALKERGR